MYVYICIGIGTTCVSYYVIIVSSSVMIVMDIVMCPKRWRNVLKIQLLQL